MLFSKTRIRNVAFIIGFLALLLYDFHRYIFKYNSEGTSPTYADTPLVWKVSKYLILSVIMGVFFSVANFTRTISKWHILIYVFVAIVVVVNILNFFVYGIFNNQETEYCFWFLLLLPYCFVTDSVFNIDLNYNKLLTWAAIVLYASNAVAIANYLFTGRLPALAYEGGLVRFGGFWDDPNSFGILCVFYFYYFINKKKYLLALFSVINILVAFSFTAYFLLLLSMLYWAVTTYKSFNKKWTMFGVCVFALISAFVVYYWDLLVGLYEIKAESVTEHLTQKMIFNPAPLFTSPLQFSENWYESSFYNYFPFSILMHAAMLWLFLSLFVNSQNKALKFFFFLFITSSFFFSMLYTFPMNFVFIFLLIDYVKTKREASFQNTGDNLVRVS